MEQDLHLFTFDLCPFCKPVEYLLHMNNIKFNSHQLNLAQNEHKCEEFLKINPTSKVPAIVDNGFVLFESNTIMRYLCNTRNIADEWYPKDPWQRALIDLYFDWHAQNIDRLTKYYFTSMGLSGLSKECAKLITDDAMNDLINIFLSRRRFLASECNLTIADLSLTWHFQNLNYYGYEFSNRVWEYFQDLLNNLPGIKENFSDFNIKREQFLDAVRKK